MGSDGVYNPADGVSRYLPSAATDNSGNVALAYTMTGASVDPSTAYTDANGASPTDNALDDGTVPYTVDANYGRYSTLSLDPLDRCTLWLTAPFPDPNSQGREEFWDRHFSLAGCSPSGARPPDLTGDPSWSAPLVREGQAVTGSAGSFNATTGTSYQWLRCDTNGWNCTDITGANSTSYTPDAADAAGTHTLRFGDGHERQRLELRSELGDDAGPVSLR